MNECQRNRTRVTQLPPFFHQVGGHSSMFQYDRETLCKVLDLDELNFYQTMPEFLKTFAPEFRGIITAYYCKDKLGYIQLMTQTQTRNSDQESSSDESADQNPIEFYSSDDSQDLANYQQGQTATSKINPWILQLSKKNAEKLHKELIRDGNFPVSQQFMLLENVTARFCHPCILDLKMGKRQYAELDSDEKRQSKIEKCQLSTSSTLGVRLCGMQVYQIDESRYKFTDKYRGRMLNVEGFRSSLNEFLNNGRYKRFEILPKLIERLESLHEKINSLLKYRFYSGSLLIVYDGLENCDLIELRMIDFAHTILVDDSSTIEPDRDYLFGLQSLIDVFRNILTNQTN